MPYTKSELEARMSQARELRERTGCGPRKIMAATGLTERQARLICYGERERKTIQRDNANRRKAKREWEREWLKTARAVCPGCGGPCGAGSSKPSVTVELCSACRSRQRNERCERIVAWWAEGLSLREIARRLGWTTNHVNAEFGRMRNEGFDLPYRRTPEQVARIREGRWGKAA